VFHVLAKMERGKHGSGEPEWLIIVECPAGNKVNHDFTLVTADY